MATEDVVNPIVTDEPPSPFPSVPPSSPPSPSLRIEFVEDGKDPQSSSPLAQELDGVNPVALPAPLEEDGRGRSPEANGILILDEETTTKTPAETQNTIGEAIHLTPELALEQRSIGGDAVLVTAAGDEPDAAEDASLSEAFRTILVPSNGNWLSKVWAFVGPGYLIAVGYMDPGNWATDIAGGSTFGYTLLFVVTVASLLAMFFQTLSLRLGIVTNKDLAQTCREAMPRKVNIGVWLTTEIAIVSTDLAELIGSAIALKLLFRIPLIGGIFITALDVFIIMFLQHRRFRWIELIVFMLILTITVCFIMELSMSRPDVTVLKAMFVPSAEIFTNSEALYVAIGILGATIMPHNLYLHSSIAQTRAYSRSNAGVREAVKYATLDSTWALIVAYFVNAAILILASDAFNRSGMTDVATLEDAYQLLTPVLGSSMASTIFGVALLLSGQNSTLTGTMAGQIVMEGFLRWKISPIYRRLLTRLVALVPAIIAVVVAGDQAVNALLVGSQVALSFQLAFAIFPLTYFTSDPRRMGAFANAWYVKWFGYTMCFGLTALNVWLLISIIGS